MFFFPVIPRLLAHLRSMELAPLMSWHADNMSTDDVMRVPADSGAWRKILENPKFSCMAEEPRNAWLGCAMDGVNPYSNNSASHSTWPIMLVLYNLPPWLSIQNRHIMLSAIVPGKLNPNDFV